MKGEFSHSVYVASVRVTGVVWLDDSKFRRPVKLKQPLMLGNIPGGFDPYSGANYRVEVLRAFKGKPKRHLTIFSENTEARTPLDVGKSYLVFLQRGTVLGGPPESKANDLMIDYCGNSSHLENAQQIIRVIARN